MPPASPTPIGNLEDITLRAIRVLKEANVIYAEDTRTTSILLKHFEIDKRAVSYHKFNEHSALERCINTIQSSHTVALVSDAGTPSISDPGFLLVRECVKKGIDVECLPGATAMIPALVVSGFPSDSFCFEGFLPQKKGRHTKLLGLKDEKRTIILYESPYRIIKLLEELHEHIGERPISVSRELSKKFEETVRGTASELLLHFKEKEPRGEFVVVISGV
ncbi:MAG: 16S rRNA (cytidine(1402)-2'-O)-methyltransferase [Bacteroidales bacterium]